MRKEPIEMITFNVIDSKKDIEDILKLRYRVFVSEYGYFSKNDTEKMIDEYDFNEDTIHIGAFDKNAELIGATRIVINNNLGIPSKQYFDFTKASFSKEYGFQDFKTDKLVDINRLVISKKSHKKLITNYKKMTSYKLMKFTHSIAKQVETRFCCVVLNPRLIKLFLLLGYRIVGSQKICNKNKLPFIPLLGEMNKLACEDISHKFSYLKN